MMCYCICEKCFNDEFIKKEIRRLNNKGKCDCCKSTDVYVINDEQISELIAPYCLLYVQYNYGAKDYNEHSGGDIYELVENENLFLNVEQLKDTLCECLLDDLLRDENGNLNERYDFSYPIKNHYDYFPYKGYKEDDVFVNQMKFVDSLYNNIKDYLENKKIPSILYRARIGFDIDHENKILLPYNGLDIGAAPFKKCNEGRANRSFVSFLYLAENIKTAIHEVRATKGDLVSVGTFSPKNALKIFNLAYPDIFKCSRSDGGEKILYDISFLNHLFSRPSGSEDKYIYLPTQLVVEKIIAEGYEGICFRSSFTNDLNYVVFDPSLMNSNDKDGKLFSVQGVQCSYKEFKNWDD